VGHEEASRIRPEEFRVVECSVEGCRNTFKVWGPEPAKPLKCHKKCGVEPPGTFG